MSISAIRGFFFLLFATCISAFWACNSKKDQTNDIIRRYVKVADSLAIVGKSDTAISILNKQRKLFKSSDPEIVAYYNFMSRMYFTNGPIATLYADSALTIFGNKVNIDQYPEDYYNTLLAKADALISQKQYANALGYYDSAKKLATKRDCDGGYLTSRIGGIYFHQQNYTIAAHYWVQSYRELQACHKNKSAQEIFFLTQGTLDNIGVMYQKAGMYDSAAYYYKKNVAYINQVAAEGKIAKETINSPRFVVYDNLGGLALNQGKLDEAEKYLTACIAIPVKDVDGMRIPPFMKQAELYLKTKQYDKAAIAFSESKRLLNLFGKENPVPNIEWNNLYAQYLFTQHRTEDAYQYQAKYIRLKDSLDKTNSKLRALDVERELNSIQRENLLAELEHNQRVQKLYIIGVTVVLVLLLVISLSVFRVLKESRKNHKNTRLHNQQQQQALEELERANQNIIRIMGIMAHDLRNPLSGMIGLANAIFEDEASEENKHMLKLLETTGIHSLEMINELLKSGLTNEDELLVKQELDIKELLRDSVELLQFKANEKKQEITFESDNAPIITAINHEKIWRVFNNLIVNAIKFSYMGGLIFVSIKALTEKRKILIAIADNGMGIPEADKDKIFEMFTPVKRLGTEGEQPFGLGLSISKRIIENHNGRLWFESSPGFGTTFYIELPL
ncbi:HAMP domain-containing sensor histidine kinase [Mucilaginibacter sp. dw_454]|uniref:tetratricopeptide repeat-containing sensor histidine kinase n=1 Tax=Mucilaginibacter sp. dw_454 TaxID=2720079 RepID=UPI001BD66138|nr:HAMP domain-containing sensor histidine kinase [Mucilaginibacter sp. dw_454]